METMSKYHCFVIIETALYLLFATMVVIAWLGNEVIWLMISLDDYFILKK